MCQCTPPDGNRSSLCKTASHSFWCLKKCSDFCQTLYDAVSARYTSIHDCYRHEPFYQCTGVFHNRDVSVAIGAIANILLDPLFIFTFHLGVNGAAAATVLSQILSALFVFHFLRRKAEIKVRLLRKMNFPPAFLSRKVSSASVHPVLSCSSPTVSSPSAAIMYSPSPVAMCTSLS